MPPVSYLHVSGMSGLVSALDQRQDDILRHVGLGQHRGRRLLQDLGLGKVCRLYRIIRILNTAEAFLGGLAGCRQMPHCVIETVDVGANNRLTLRYRGKRRVQCADMTTIATCRTQAFCRGAWLKAKVRD